MEAVFVYRNLHYRDCVRYSVKSLASGRVVAHKAFIHLKGVKLKVSKAGQERVLREFRKNVHAGVVGTMAADGESMAVSGWIKVRYNPYVGPYFFRADNNEKIFEAKEAYINEEGVFVLL